LNTESPLEDALLAALLPHGWTATGYELGPWRLSTQRDVSVDGQNYRVDLAIVSPFRRFAVEVDGHEYHSSPEDAAKDAARDRALVIDGWTVMRFTGREIHRTPEACARDVMRAMGIVVGGSESASVQGETPKARPVDGACSTELVPPTTMPVELVGRAPDLYSGGPGSEPGAGSPSAVERLAERLRAARAAAETQRETPHE
jgi:very-short-patch-repair endonuclease